MSVNPDSDYLLSDDDLDAFSSTKEKHDYRVIMYNKADVERLERATISEMLELEPTAKYSDAFMIKAYQLYPDKFPELASKKKRGKKSGIYFIEDVAKYLWSKWNISREADQRNDFLTYCYPLIDGVIFKYQRHKHGLAYEEIFQGAILKIIQAMDKFDPARVVGRDDNGNPIYARVYTYFTMILNFGLTTITMAYGAEKISNCSYEQLSNLMGIEVDHVTDASTVFSDLLMVLDSLIISEDVVEDCHLDIYKSLQKHLTSAEGQMKIKTNIISTIRADVECKAADITSALEILKNHFGPFEIYKHSIELSEDRYDY